jgi:hypothetical protein
MKLSFTKLEAEMLLAAACRMECDDIWDDPEEGGMYTLKQGAALESAARKLATKLNPTDDAASAE